MDGWGLGVSGSTSSGWRAVTALLPAILHTPPPDAVHRGPALTLSPCARVLPRLPQAGQEAHHGAVVGGGPQLGHGAVQVVGGAAVRDARRAAHGQQAVAWSQDRCVWVEGKEE